MRRGLGTVVVSEVGKLSWTFTAPQLGDWIAAPVPTAGGKALTESRVALTRHEKEKLPTFPSLICVNLQMSLEPPCSVTSLSSIPLCCWSSLEERFVSLLACSLDLCIVTGKNGSLSPSVRSLSARSRDQAKQKKLHLKQ